MLVCVSCFSDPAPASSGGQDTDGDTNTSGTTTSDAPTTSSSVSTGHGESTTHSETSSEASGTTTTTGADSSGSTTGGEEPWSPQVAWLTRFDSELEANGDRVDEVIVAQDGTLWVAGAFALMPARLFVAQLDADDGTILNSSTLESAGLTNARGLAESSTGIIVAGHGDSPVGSTDRLLIEYDPETETFGDPYDFGLVEGLDIVESVVVGANDIRFSAGVTQVDGEQRAWVERLPSVGPTWSAELGAGADGNRVMDLHRFGPPDNFDLILTGALRSDGDEQDTAWVSRYSITGVERWSTLLVSDDGHPTVARGATAGISSSVLVVGTVAVPGEGSNAWAQQLQDSGRTGWYWSFDGGFAADDVAHDVASDPDGDVFVCGSSVGDTTGADLWVARLDRNGSFRGQFSLDLGMSEDDVISSCVITDDHLIIAGRGHTPKSVRRDGFIAALPL